MKKMIFVILDGCGYTLAKENCGFLEHMAESGQAAKYKVISQLPSMSRPLYATLLSGLSVYRHGIVNNLVSRALEAENLFSLCRAAGLTTAAAAYHWICELFITSPFQPLQDRFVLNSPSPIQNGIYYFEDDYPDSHLFADALFLIAQCEPDFLLVHSMNIDFQGHQHRGGSREQAVAAMKADLLLSAAVPQWLAQGYQVVITADHGMNENGLHGGNTPAQREVPLYLFSPQAAMGIYEERPVDQLLVAPLLCRLLDLLPAAGMQDITALEVVFHGA
ncbi:putative proteins of the AP superfamily [Desulfitobacterium sp. LBE]|uniref:alkaline phosphatase family protein n=1 Tax=Desulfitobacterium sp. LBE TaxID=884086 RepID=UPI00119C1A12|nr:alkaline phosphatase family protein [Desulfitobacterium sp. LBE]TWH55968.1 putative proteins of the AP superfamily [Desulfitobacterium sp. LBE]